MRVILSVAAVSAVVSAAVSSAGPALAAIGPFISLKNTDFIVLLSFIAFIGVLLYFKVPGMVGGLLDKRAAGITRDLADARAIRDEARALVASYEQKQGEIRAEADRIVATARREAEDAALRAKADLALSIERRLKSAEDQITAAEAAALKEVRLRAVEIATRAAADVIARQLAATDKAALIDRAIAEVGAKLH